MNDDLGDLRAEQLREALGLLGGSSPADAPRGRPAAARALRDVMATPGLLRQRLVDAPPGAADAFARLVREGPLAVEALLGRGWWGRGLLPSPLDWLQRRAMISVLESGRVAATAAARQGWQAQQLRLTAPDAEAAGGGATDGTVRAIGHAAAVPEADDTAAPPAAGGSRESAPVTVEAARSVVVGEDLGRVLAVPAAALTAVAPTVAVSKLEPGQLRAALRSAGVRLREDEVVDARREAPALPGSAERALTPWDIRAVVRRAVDEQRQVHLEYYPSSRGGASTERTVDPWSFADDLLVGWCHLRLGERTFAIDRIGSATLLATTVEHPPPPAPASPSPPA